MTSSNHWLPAFAMGIAATIFACGGTATDPVDDGGDGDVTVITLTNGLTFSPSTVTISPGTTVRWVNGTSLSHTVTPAGHSEWSRWATSSQNQTFEHTFGSAGTFAYFCEPHQAAGMSGVITVQ